MVNPDRNLYEPPYDDALLYESDLEPERRRSRPLIVLLGFVVLAAFSGVVWVAYNQGVKHGQTPVLVAETGPTRIPGQTASGSKGVAPAKDHRQLFRADAEPESVTLLPAPEQPRTVPADEAMPIQPTDTVSSQGGPPISKSSDLLPPAGDAGDPRIDPATGVAPPALALGSPQSIVGASPSPVTARGVPANEDITGALMPSEMIPTPDSTPRPVLAPKQAIPAVKAPAKAKPIVTQAAPSGAPGLTAPTKSAPIVQPALPSAPADAAIAQLSPGAAASASSPGGSVMIQLGSFPNDGLAASAWSKIKMANQELLGTYSPTIQAKEIDGKGTWYRLRVAGFADKSAAREVCDQLTANGQACIIAAK